MPSYLLECCVDSVESALNAGLGGADRLELCSGLVIGGITPTLSLYEQIRRHTALPIHVLIRPRFGDFLYSEEELSVMEKDILTFRRAGAQGVVIGCLQADGTLDLEAMKRLMAAAEGMSVTLHRAFDMCRDPLEALEQAKQLGVHTILTSGQADTCIHAIPLLNQLCRLAGSSLTILAGGGINADAVRLLLSCTALTAFHMSGKKILESAMRFRNPHVSMGLPGMSEYEIWRTDPESVRAVRRLLR
ncbi:MAG TPA: copper homeostasis protein CutC [Candidatus Eisenbergiella merdipullorum]|uniref:PF03932 family protein CutC n=1 Tax=Candidatus Eisenbergiella merdipullorum TaxID=2838553 RepID=A0A9D2L053_9FIRM|nr:copper homeostasis protein CutC [Candidatus Eisenbergiella merdipullorum]